MKKNDPQIRDVIGLEDKNYLRDSIFYAIIDDVDKFPVYKGDGLGLTYSPKKSVFKIWSPPSLQSPTSILQKR